MKRIVICADGTWNSPEAEHGSHVIRLARGIAPEDADGTPQVVFYDWGIGADQDRLKGGLTGVGIDKNIQDAYRFLVHNYERGDQLFLFGFSRGAYTVRSLAGFIRNAGLLTRAHAHRIPQAYALYRNRRADSAPDRARARAHRRRYAVADRTPVHFVGVWDTVGALGIPMPFLGTLGGDKYLFHDTAPSRIIRHARHAVSIDENREDFPPALWTPKPGIDLCQVWFPGVHSDVGGGYAAGGLGECAAAWMVAEATRCGLTFEGHFRKGLKPDPLGAQHDEYRGFYRLLRDRVQREVEPMLHRSAWQRWQATPRRRSPALAALLKRVDGDWGRITLVD